ARGGGVVVDRRVRGDQRARFQSDAATATDARPVVVDLRIFDRQLAVAAHVDAPTPTVVLVRGHADAQERQFATDLQDAGAAHVFFAERLVFVLEPSFDRQPFEDVLAPAD